MKLRSFSNLFAIEVNVSSYNGTIIFVGVFGNSSAIANVT